MREIWSPWMELDALLRGVDRALSGGPPGAGGTAAPPTFVEEDDDGWRMTLDLPGVRPEDLEVEQRGSTLRIEGVRRIGERTVRLARTLQMPPAAEATGVEARLEHGVLSLRVPRAERDRPRRLEIRTGRTGIEDGAPTGDVVEGELVAGGAR